MHVAASLIVLVMYAVREGEAHDNEPGYESDIDGLMHEELSVPVPDIVSIPIAGEHL